MKEYLVPRAVVSRIEVFPGFGVIELLGVVAGGAIGAVLQMIANLLPLAVGPKIFIRFFVFALPLAAAYGLVRQDIGGGSALKELQIIRRWFNSTKVYYFQRGGVS